MTPLCETARAKLNLTLEVLGRRADGYHELVSLVAFAELGDAVELRPGNELALSIDGPFADALSRTDNLIVEAAKAAKDLVPGLVLGEFRLTKSLPVAAGLGGGSADAAAALRLLARANQDALSPEIVHRLAQGLGSDVTACLTMQPALMSGRGERVSAVQGFPGCGVVLANPGVELPTASVYVALEATPLSSPDREQVELPDFQGSFERLIDYTSERANDLEPAALKLAPMIGEVLASLSALAGARLARLSGSGATCFALFESEGEAAQAMAALSASRPNWWVAASRLG